mgnify:CR=1 FL=1
MSEKLKSCPFCGDDEPLMRGDDWSYVECDECDASGPECKTEAEAITAWNTRAGEKA